MQHEADNRNLQAKYTLGKILPLAEALHLTTQAIARYAPSIITPVSHHGDPIETNKFLRAGCKVSTSREAITPDGILAPTIVTQNITPRTRTLLENRDICL